MIIWEQSTSKCKAGWIPAEHVTIHNTEGFTKVLILYPYKMQNLHEITNTDKRKRVIFVCVIANANMRVCLSTYQRLFFSDECIFRLNGSRNTQNVRFLGTEAPVEGRTTFSLSPSIMVRCRIPKEKAIVPCFFRDQNVSGENYRNMWIQYAFPYLAWMRADYIFLQDGAPAHYSSRVKTYLDNKRPGNWIGRRGLVERLPRSPDFTPCDFFCGAT